MDKLIPENTIIPPYPTKIGSCSLCKLYNSVNTNSDIPLMILIKCYWWYYYYLISNHKSKMLFCFVKNPPIPETSLGDGQHLSYTPAHMMEMSPAEHKLLFDDTKGHLSLKFLFTLCNLFVHK